MTADSCRHSLWGALPSGARESGQRDGIRIVEVTEDLPDQVKPDESFSAWLVWPETTGNGRRIPSSSGPLRSQWRLKLPSERFMVGVRPLVRAVRKKGNEEGLLTMLCFDPQRKGPLQYPWPEVFQGSSRTENANANARGQDGHGREIHRPAVSQAAARMGEFHAVNLRYVHETAAIQSPHGSIRSSAGLAPKALGPTRFLQSRAAYTITGFGPHDCGSVHFSL